MAINILFTCAGRRNYLINYFKEALTGEGNVVAVDVRHNAPALVDADISALVPDIYDPSYVDALIEVIKKYEVNAVISLNDLELPILAKHKEKIEKNGVKVLLSDEKVIATTFDKWKTAQFISSIGLNTPKTYLTLESALEAMDKKVINFPLVLKPRWGSASIGIEYPENLIELRLIYQLQQIKLKSSILKNASETDLEHAILIQEKLEGEEYGMDVLNDFESNYIGCYARKKLSMRSGETDKALSVTDPLLEANGKKIGESLKHIGSMDCDLFIDNGKVFVLELNPRFGGGYAFSHEAGVNIAAIYVAWLKGIKDIEPYIKYQQGLSFSKCDRLIKIPN